MSDRSIKMPGRRKAAILCVSLGSQGASEIFKHLSNEMIEQLTVEMAKTSSVEPEIAESVLDEFIETAAARGYIAEGGLRYAREVLERAVGSQRAGVRALASILNASNRATERNILDHLNVEDADLAEEVRRLLFVFEDILKLDDRAIQMVLREVDSKDLALAMRGSTPDVQEKILANVSQRGSEMLREEMEFMPPQRRRVVEEAQTKIVAVVRRLEDAGEIVIARGGGATEDELVL